MNILPYSAALQIRIRILCANKNHIKKVRDKACFKPHSLNPLPKTDDQYNEQPPYLSMTINYLPINLVPLNPS